MTQPIRRELADGIVLSSDGRIDPRITIEMPLYTADGLAHILADADRVARVFGGFPDIGMEIGALATALHELATSGPYNCPLGGLERDSQS